jgi:type I restriction-modification system DNA methylase subunit
LIDLVNAGRWKDLFIEELGWTKPTLKPLVIPLEHENDEHDVTLTEVAQYKGVRIWLCNELFDARTQRFVDREVKKHSTERLIIFADQFQQEWRWPQASDDQGRGKTRLVSHMHAVGRANPALEQRLRLIEIGVAESPSILEVLKRLRAAFDADRVTKAFYDKFQKRHEALVEAIEGFPDYKPERTDEDRKLLNQERKWYSSLLLNRLMFIYFLQRKGFMDGDRDYLRHRLEAVKEASGPDRFFEFYADFLIPMFHDGLGESGLNIKDATIKKLVGDIPYINGGIFAVHELEVTYDDIHIGDGVFESIFDLFDGYQWHLDDRPTGNPNEINPDVLGHIFEQFINQKQMGAYYTKEDVTQFMTSSTVLPVFLARVETRTGVNPWACVAADPGRYIWEGVRYGLDPELPYPEPVEQQRTEFPRPAWNEKAPEKWALPGETWWEVDHRRSRYERLLAAAKAGEIDSANAAVTANIDMETLALDVIDGLDAPEDVVTIWEILTDLKIIDPTCGSGAFLFAALKTLLGLYDAVLDAARSHAVTSNDTAIRALIADVDAHPSQSYFILKHSALRNLYGVDIMKEATEIARLRLFLKLVAVIGERDHLEPLPDLDFNIKPGNLLVGARTVDEVSAAADLLSQKEVLDQATAAANVVADSYNTFRDASEVGNEKTINTARKALSSALASARLAINRTYFGGRSTSDSYDDWVRTHVPFHWFIEFPEVFAGGGFDVVIGNPPYVATRKVTDYRFGGFATDATPDIYAPCTERAAQITRPDGRMTMILPISAQFGSDFTSLRSVLEKRFANLWVSTYSRNPAALFSAGLGVRSTIVVGSGDGRSGNTLHVTKTHRWVDDYRPTLFETLSYVDAGRAKPNAGWIRLVDNGLENLLTPLLAQGRLSQLTARRGGSSSVGFKTTALYWLSVFLDDPPAYDLDLQPTAQTKVGRVVFPNTADAKLALAIAASKLAFVWWYCTGDDFDVTADILKSTPVDAGSLSAEARTCLVKLAEALVADLPNHVAFTKYAGKWMGNFVLSEMRDVTDQIDEILAEQFGYTRLLPALEHAYYCVYKPTGDRPGTLRYDPSRSTKA